MKKETRLKIAIIILSVFIFIINLPGTVFAIGEYDGVWLGMETINVPNYGSMTEKNRNSHLPGRSEHSQFWGSYIRVCRSGKVW